MKHHIRTCLKGVKQYCWRKNLRGFFEFKGRSLTDAEVRKLVLYGIAHNYECESDIPTEEVTKLLGWDKEKKKEKIYEPMLF